MLGGVNQVDTAAFESVWNNIKDKYVSEVSKLQSDERETCPDHDLDLVCLFMATVFNISVTKSMVHNRFLIIV